MRLVCISDTHGFHPGIHLPEGDVLLHGGDWSRWYGELRELKAFAAWMGGHPHKRKIVVAGNHDVVMEEQREAAEEVFRNAGITYLRDQEVTYDGVRFWGAPWQVEYRVPEQWAFNLPLGAPLKAKWDLIPEGIDVLITHGPPFGIFDQSLRRGSVGCPDLLKTVLERVRPRVHCFGHIHECGGKLEREGVTFVNAAICEKAKFTDEGAFFGFRKPVVVDI